MKSFFISIILIYLTVCFLLYLFQRHILYFPQRSLLLPNVNTISFEFEDITLKGWVLHEGKSKALIYYGGNAENIEMNVDFFKEQLRDHTIYLIPYRGYGENSGTPSEKALYWDALRIYDFVNSKHKEVALMGRSLGSGVATYVGSQREISRMILVTPFDSIENVAKEIYWMFPISLLIRDRYRSSDRVSNITAPTLMLIASEDRIIPRRHSERLKTFFDPSRITSVVLKGATHNDIHLFGEYALSIKNFLSVSTPAKKQTKPPKFEN